jgi:23S rRNA (cytidine1920-2'-O)/16S rRNA (cytidine1409-2'-O)-methyltransferase
MKGVRLDEAVAASAGVTRSRARSLILAGRIRVDGRMMTKPGTCIPATAHLDVERTRPYVGRGGEKLEGALHAFGLDVGYGQLDYSLRADSRVTVMERCNFRLLPGDAFAEPFDIVTIDTSFISVVTMIARAKAFLHDGGCIVALIKPQFEAGPARLGKGGVVRDARTHRAILSETCAAIRSLDLSVRDVQCSPLRGASGNIEFFALIARGGAMVTDADLDGVVAQAHAP